MPKLSEIQAEREKRRKANEHATPYEDALARFWDLAVQLRKKDGIPGLSHHPGVWTRKLDDRWTLKANGHGEPIDDVPPYSFHIEYNGWPAGVIDPNGAVFAAGTLANLDTFNAALEAAIADDPAQTD